MKRLLAICVCVLALMSVGLCSVDAALITEIFDLTVSANPGSDPSGLSARAIFTLDTANPTELKIELINKSTGVPAGFDNSDQLLTAISFDFGQPGYNGDTVINGGTVVIGPGGQSLNFNQITTQLTAGDDVSGEWGYGNMDGTGLLTNFVSANRGGATAFGGTNLDGPDSIDGPQAGISTDPPRLALDGLGAIADSAIITVTLDTALSDLDFLAENGVMAEFGSDAEFLVPEPATVALLGLGVLRLVRMKRTA